VTTESEKLFSQSLKKIELVCWSGNADTLAFRLGLSVEDLFAGLARVADTRNGRLKLEVALPSNRPVFAAAKRALLRPPDAEPADALLHLADARW